MTDTGRSIALVPILVLVAALAGCQSGPAQPTPSAASAEAVTSPAASVTPTADPNTTEGRFAVAEDGRELAILCEGSGSPTVVLEDGHPSETGGIARFAAGDLWPMLTAETRVCAYDRAGYGESDPAPNEPRSADDVVGVVLLDVPAPTDTLTLDEIPELAWDHPANPEHVDVIPEFETRFARNPQPMQARLVVVTATNGQSDVTNQAFWLPLSPEATQVELDGGHDIAEDDPVGVADVILETVDAIR